MIARCHGIEWDARSTDLTILQPRWHCCIEIEAILIGSFVLRTRGYEVDMPVLLNYHIHHDRLIVYLLDYLFAWRILYARS